MLAEAERSCSDKIGSGKEILNKQEIMKRPQDYTVRIDWQATSHDYGVHNILALFEIGTETV